MESNKRINFIISLCSLLRELEECKKDGEQIDESVFFLIELLVKFLDGGSV